MQIGCPQHDHQGRATQDARTEASAGCFGLGLPSPRMQNRLRVAVGLCGTFKDKVTGSLKRDALVEVWRHICVDVVVFILSIDYCRHTLQRLHDLRFAANAVAQPVGNVLALDPQGRTVFHQANVIDVRHFRAADTLIDPAYNVA